MPIAQFNIRASLILFLVFWSCHAAGQVPVISSVSPLIAKPGDTITISGSNFASSAGANKVLFGTTFGEVVSVSASTLKVKLDTGAAFGPVTLLNSDNGLSAVQPGRLLPVYRNDSFFSDTISIRNTVNFYAGGAGALPYIVVPGDLDLDGKPDLVVDARYSSPGPGKLFIYNNTGTSTWINASSFTQVLELAAGNQPANVKLADLDGDGLLDIVVAILGASRVGVFRNISVPGSIQFESLQTFSTSPMGVAPYVVAIDDFNKDGRPDVAVTCRDSANVLVFRNTSVPGVISLAYNNTYRCGHMPISLTSGDFDGDGWPDIAVADDSTISMSVSVLKNTSTADSISFAPRNIFPTPGRPSDIHAVDINGDGKLDLAVSVTSTDYVAVYDNLTTSTSDTIVFGPAILLATSASPSGIGIGDMNGDGKPDLVVSNSGINQVSFFRNTSAPAAPLSSASFAPRLNITCGSIPIGVNLCDLNGDTYPEIIVESNIFGNFSVLRNYPLPKIDTVSGPRSVCMSTPSVTYTNSVTGGVWALSNYVRATINSATGELTPLAGGIDTVIYYKIFGGDSNSRRLIIRIDTLPNVPATTGINTICVGATTTLTNMVTGGTWSVTDPVMASVVASGSTVTLTGLSGGDVQVLYTQTNSCGSDADSFTMHVIAPPSAGAIDGPSGVCGTDSAQLTNFVAGGTWSVASAAIATINTSGKIFGLVPGSTTVSYTRSNSCGSNSATKPFTVHVAPDAGTISGATSVCQASGITLSDPVTIGAWSSGNTSVATVSSSGVVHGVSGGSVIISYTVVNSCGTDVDTQMVTVNPLPVPGTISGATSVCAGVNITLSTTGSGGTWSSGATSIATVASSGMVHGVAAGVVIISYTASNSCGTLSDTQLVTVNPQPVAGTITGTRGVCVGSQLTLTNLTSGGTWSSNATATATVNDGIVTGVAAGNAIISYSVTNICGTISDTHMITVNPLPVSGTLTGANTVCESQSVTLTPSLTGGSWTTGALSIATVTSSGMVTGLAPGTAIITYTRTNICGPASDTQMITVNPLPVPGIISGPVAVCAGVTISLTASAGGGSWSSGATGVATVSSGTVGGVAAGLAIISYSATNSCGTRSDTQLITVDPQPNAGTITGTFIVCQGQQLTLTNAATGGSWSSGTTAVATVNTSGVVFGVAPGSTIITYTHTNSCGTATDTQMVTVNPAPFAGTITGINRVCAGTDITLANSTAGGTWTSGAIAVATVAAGNVHGITAGFTNISYSVSNSCGTAVDTHRVQVDPQPVSGTITGLYQVCTGFNITLTGAAPGGTWSSSADAIASVAGGVVHGNTIGTAIISYSVTNICGTAVDTQMVTVNLSPDAGTVSGPSSVCVGAQISLTSTAAGGSWSSSALGVATVSGGEVGGASAGTAIISYSVTNGCGTAVDTQMIRVDPLPVAGSISGSSVVCTGNTITLIASVPGGVWAAINGNATVLSGAVTAISPGLDTIIYSVTNMCGTDSTAHVVDIELTPDAGTISGPSSVCAGQVITLTETVPGGAWSVSNARATVSGGVVTGVSMGATIVSYTVTNSCGSVHATHPLTVDSLRHPGVITGAPSVCVSVSVTLSDTASGGVWSVTNTNASITTGGVVTGLAVGTDTVVYTVTNVCGSSSATREIIINNSPYTDTISGPSSVCQGLAITLANATSGGVWTSADNTIATVDGAGGVYGASGGTVLISYSVTSVCGTAVAIYSVTVNPLPDAGTLTGPAIVCVGTTVSLSASVAGGAWSSATGNTAVAAGVVTGIAAGTDTIRYIVSNICGSDTSRFAITVMPMADTGIITGASSVCEGSGINLSDTVTGGAWSSSAPSIASVSVAGVVTGVAPGLATIMYTVGSGCSVQSANHIVQVMQLPYFSSSILPPGICDNTLFSYVPGSSVSAATFSWSRDVVAGISNTAATGTGSIAEVLHNTTPYPVTVAYQYIVSSSACADTALVEITVKPTPVLIQPLTTALCGDTLFGYTLSSLTPATSFAWTRGTTTGVVPVTASGSGDIADSVVNVAGGTATVVYTVTLTASGCSNTQLLTVYLSEGAHQPHITTRSPSVLCQGTMYQNFGTSDSLYPGEQFTWTADHGAIVWASGLNHRYSLINFPGPGMAWVYLSNTQTLSGCTLRDSFAVWVAGGPLEAPAVARFGSDFICQDNEADIYQWGYDDKTTLDSTLLSGETNQNYYNEIPDLAGKYYWVITEKVGCSQKSYYNAPVAVTNVNAVTGKLVVAPNPNNGTFRVVVNATITEPADITVTDVAGRTLLVRKCTTNTSQDITIDGAAGIYFVTVRTAPGTFTERILVSK